MAEKWQLQQQKNKGERAKAFRSNEVVGEALQKMEDRYFSEFIDSSSDDIDGREITYLKMQVLKDFQQEITSMISVGIGAATQLIKDAAQDEAKSGTNRG